MKGFALLSSGNPSRGGRINDILLNKGLKGKARIPIDGLVPKTRHCRNIHSMAFQILSASIEAYISFFPWTIRD